MQISVGVGPSRLVAKCCSDLGKPAGFVAMGREEACERFATAPTSRVPGIGPKTADRLAELGYRTIGQLQRADEGQLAARFGSRTAGFLKSRAEFRDDSPVETEQGVAKSRSSETTFDTDIAELEQLEAVMRRQAAELCEGLARRGPARAHDRDQGPARRLDDGHPRPLGRGADQRRRAGHRRRARAAARVRAAAPGAAAGRAAGLVRGRGRAAAPGGAARRGQLALPIVDAELGRGVLK